MIKTDKRKILKIGIGIALSVMLIAISIVPAFAAGDVSTAIESTWKSAQSQIKSVVNNKIPDRPLYYRRLIQKRVGGQRISAEYGRTGNTLTACRQKRRYTSHISSPCGKYGAA